MKQELNLPFPVLSDSGRELIAKWGLLNEKEKGGIAFPAVFAIDRILVVRFRSLDKTMHRAGTAEVATIVDEVAKGGAPAEIARRRLRPGALFLSAIVNAIRRGTKTPWAREER